MFRFTRRGGTLDRPSLPSPYKGEGVTRSVTDEGGHRKPPGLFVGAAFGRPQTSPIFPHTPPQRWKTSPSPSATRVSRIPSRNPRANHTGWSDCPISMDALQMLSNSAGLAAISSKRLAHGAARSMASHCSGDMVSSCCCSNRSNKSVSTDFIAITPL